MRELNLTNYKLIDGEGDYPLVKTLCLILFGGNQQVNAREAIARNKLCEKIEACESQGYILLEDAEYEKLKNSVESLTGLVRNDVEMVNRVLEAPEVNVAKLEEVK